MKIFPLLIEYRCSIWNRYTSITVKRHEEGKLSNRCKFYTLSFNHCKGASTLDEAKYMEWKEGNAKDFPFEDEIFDVLLSNFGRMFAYLRYSNKRNVTKKSEGRMAFAR